MEVERGRGRDTERDTEREGLGQEAVRERKGVREREGVNTIETVQ